MNRNLIIAVVVIVLAAGGFWLYSRSKTDSLPDLAPVGANLIEGLGDYSMPVTSKNKDVQRWFDQGLAMTYGFNHDAAERSFLKAAELDPDCAMCWWGASLVLGPHVNAAMDPANNPKAWDRLQRAQKTAEKANEKEQAFIKALSTRYAENAPEDRRPLDEAYAAAMAELAAKYPDDLDVVTFHAESMMDLQPWDYWDASGQPKGHTAEVVSQLESVIGRDPKHAGALHLYVHAVEASPDPAKGVAAADTLRELWPGSGHLVHMPAHIYARVGRFHDAVIANQKAIAADDSYLAICQPAPGVYPLGYVPHNHHFLWFAATMEGASKIALDAARTTSDKTNNAELMRMPGLEFTQNFALSPLFADVRFGRWEEVVKAPKPADDFPYMQAIWNYAQGMAAVRQGRIEDAKRHPRGAGAGDDQPGNREAAAIRPLFADRRCAHCRAVRRGGARPRREGLRRGDRGVECGRHHRGHPAIRRASGLALAFAPGARRHAARGGQACRSRKGLPRRAAAQSRERLVAVRAVPGAEGAEEERRSEGGCGPLRESVGQRRLRPGQDLEQKGTRTFKGDVTF